MQFHRANDFNLLQINQNTILTINTSLSFSRKVPIMKPVIQQNNKMLCLSHLLHRISSDIMYVTDYLFTIRIRAEIKIKVKMLRPRMAAEACSGRRWWVVVAAAAEGGGWWLRRRKVVVAASVEGNGGGGWRRQRVAEAEGGGGGGWSCILTVSSLYPHCILNVSSLYPS